MELDEKRTNSNAFSSFAKKTNMLQKRHTTSSCADSPRIPAAALVAARAAPAVVELLLLSLRCQGSTGCVAWLLCLATPRTPRVPVLGARRCFPWL